MNGLQEQPPERPEWPQDVAKIKLVCSGYSKHSKICHDQYLGLCPLWQIEETGSKGSRLQIRCPRRPFANHIANYVFHSMTPNIG